MIVRYGTESFVRHFNLSICHGIDFAFFDERIPFVCSFLEESGLNLSILSIHKVHREKFALALWIRPSFHGILFYHLNLDDPVLSEGIHAFEWHVLVIKWVNLFLRLVALWLILNSVPIKIGALMIIIVAIDG